MKKILFIDDELDRLENIKKRCQQSSLIKFASSVYEYFEPSDSGKSVRIIKSIDDFEYYFIHKSINDINIPETIFIAIKNVVGENKLFCFSGGSANSPREGILKRETVYENFIRFIEFSAVNNEWYLPSLISGDYEKKYALKLRDEILKTTIRIDELPGNSSYQKLIKLIQIKPDLYLKFDSLNSFFEAINYKIEEL